MEECMMADKVIEVLQTSVKQGSLWTDKWDYQLHVFEVSDDGYLRIIERNSSLGVARILKIYAPGYWASVEVKEIKT